MSLHHQDASLLRQFVQSPLRQRVCSEEPPDVFEHKLIGVSLPWTFFRPFYYSESDPEYEGFIPTRYLQRRESHQGELESGFGVDFTITTLYDRMTGVAVETTDDPINRGDYEIRLGLGDTFGTVVSEINDPDEFTLVYDGSPGPGHGTVQTLLETPITFESQADLCNEMLAEFPGSCRPQLLEGHDYYSATEEHKMIWCLPSQCGITPLFDGATHWGSDVVFVPSNRSAIWDGTWVLYPSFNAYPVGIISASGLPSDTPIGMWHRLVEIGSGGPSPYWRAHYLAGGTPSEGEGTGGFTRIYSAKSCFSWPTGFGCALNGMDERVVSIDPTTGMASVACGTRSLSAGKYTMSFPGLYGYSHRGNQSAGGVISCCP